MNFVKAAAGAICVAALPFGAALADSAAEVEAAIAGWQEMFNAGDGQAAANAVFAEDARLLPPGAPMVEGRAAIADFWQTVMDSPAHSLELGLISVDVLGDTAIETGTWSIMVPTDGGESRIGGKTLVVWKKQSDGVWRMSQDMWNDTP
ncbi:SgcJ/EcaC family oxidoreductase [Tropicimonas sp. IMCC34043]|uniref:YybH family protein n=1 Tax=Tropicimonas sp. IMCC34043 TaxID=2248760 RepID=UPI000E27D3B6|nr:SgcJ/EcaC family oxidoreductase [Tropicimonas sp. IMCC34043]